MPKTTEKNGKEDPEIQKGMLGPKCIKLQNLKTTATSTKTKASMLTKSGHVI